ncbi:MAG: BatA domain-containing protein [Planctomycetota bacterium]
MPFIHPIVFWTGLGLASAPVIIHLLNRRRFRVRDWAAMQFLLESVRKNRRRLRIEELILLALRTLVVLLLAMALARFTGCQTADILPGGDATQAVVFVLDDSYSMGHRAGSGSAFEAARTDLAEQIEQLPRTDKLAVLLASRAEQELMGLTFNAEPDSLASRVKALNPAPRRARLSDALTRAGKVLADVSGEKRVVLFSDFRRIDLAEDGEAGALAKAFQSLRDEEIELSCVDYGREGRNNLTVDKLELIDKFAVARMPARVRLSVTNHGETSADTTEIKLATRPPGEAEEASLPTVTIPLIEPGETRHVEMKFTPHESGPYVLRAELPADELPGDNEARLALDVREAVRVLMVDGRAGVDPKSGEAFFLNSALDPYDDRRYGISVDTVGTDALTAPSFEQYDLVFLLDVGQMPVETSRGKTVYPAVQALEQYVRDGGGLVIFPGDNLNASFYNGPMWAKGGGLSPFQVGQRKGDPSAGEKFYRLDPESIAPDSVMGMFTGDGAAFCNLIRFHAFTPAEESTAAVTSAEVKAPRVIAKFNDPAHSPAAVVRQIGRGEVLMIYTTASTRWNDWPIDPVGTFPGVMHATVHELARRQRQDLTALVGEPLVLPLERDESSDAKMLLTTPRFPAEPRVPLRPQAEDDRQLIRYERAGNDGVYTLQIQRAGAETREVLFARNPDPAEGDLAPGGETMIASVLGADDFQYTRRRGVAEQSLLAEQSEKEYWIWALAAMILAMTLETYLGQRFGHYTDTSGSESAA